MQVGKWTAGGVVFWLRLPARFSTSDKSFIGAALGPPLPSTTNGRSAGAHWAPLAPVTPWPPLAAFAFTVHLHPNRPKQRLYAYFTLGLAWRGSQRGRHVSGTGLQTVTRAHPQYSWAAAQDVRRRLAAMSAAWIPPIVRSVAFDGCLSHQSRPPSAASRASLEECQRTWLRNPCRPLGL